MGKPSKRDEPGEASAGGQDQDNRLEEIEIKLAYLEKELEEYKEATRDYYAKLTGMEEDIRKLQKQIVESGLPTPEVTWDSENRDIHP